MAQGTVKWFNREDRGDGEGQEVEPRDVRPVHGQDEPHHGHLLDVGAGAPHARRTCWRCVGPEASML